MLTTGWCAETAQVVSSPVLTKIEDAGELPSGLRAVVARGVERAVMGVGVAGPGPATWVKVEPVGPSEPTPSARELARRYRAILESILEHRGAAPMAEIFRGITDPGAMADIAGYSPDLTFEQKVELLETLDVETRLAKVCEWSNQTLADLALKDRINHDVAEGMEKAQREFMLRQQLAAIRRELGEEDEGEGVVAEYRRLEDEKIPEPVRRAATKEVDRLERTSEQSPEHGWLRTWLDSLFDVPWGVRTEDRLDVTEARRVLDADHTGLDDVKDRIIEHLAVRKLRAERARGRGLVAGPVTEGAAHVGSSGEPLGTGSPGRSRAGARGRSSPSWALPAWATSLGESVASALGRKFVRIALGGVRDEAEIRGHRRTYVGAQPDPPRPAGGGPR